MVDMFQWYDYWEDRGSDKVILDNIQYYTFKIDIKRDLCIDQVKITMYLRRDLHSAWE